MKRLRSPSPTTARSSSGLPSWASPSPPSTSPTRPSPSPTASASTTLSPPPVHVRLPRLPHHGHRPLRLRPSLRRPRVLLRPLHRLGFHHPPPAYRHLRLWRC